MDRVKRTKLASHLLNHSSEFSKDLNRGSQMNRPLTNEETNEEISRRIIEYRSMLGEKVGEEARNKIKSFNFSSNLSFKSNPHSFFSMNIFLKTNEETKLREPVMLIGEADNNSMFVMNIKNSDIDYIEFKDTLKKILLEDLGINLDSLDISPDISPIFFPTPLKDKSNKAFFTDKDEKFLVEMIVKNFGDIKRKTEYMITSTPEQLDRVAVSINGVSRYGFPMFLDSGEYIDASEELKKYVSGALFLKEKKNKIIFHKNHLQAKEIKRITKEWVISKELSKIMRSISDIRNRSDLINFVKKSNLAIVSFRRQMQPNKEVEIFLKDRFVKLSAKDSFNASIEALQKKNSTSKKKKQNDKDKYALVLNRIKSGYNFHPRFRAIFGHNSALNYITNHYYQTFMSNLYASYPLAKALDPESILAERDKYPLENSILIVDVSKFDHLFSTDLINSLKFFLFWNNKLLLSSSLAVGNSDLFLASRNSMKVESELYSSKEIEGLRSGDSIVTTAGRVLGLTIQKFVLTAAWMKKDIDNHLLSLQDSNNEDTLELYLDKVDLVMRKQLSEKILNVGDGFFFLQDKKMNDAVLSIIENRNLISNDKLRGVLKVINFSVEEKFLGCKWFLNNGKLSFERDLSTLLTKIFNNEYPATRKPFLALGLYEKFTYLRSKALSDNSYARLYNIMNDFFSNSIYKGVKNKLHEIEKQLDEEQDEQKELFLKNIVNYLRVFLEKKNRIETILLDSKIEIEKNLFEYAVNKLSISEDDIRKLDYNYIEDINKFIYGYGVDIPPKTMELYNLILGQSSSKAMSSYVFEKIKDQYKE